MLIGKIKLAILVVLFALSGCVISNNKKPLDKAWWVSTEFNPSQKSIKGISVSKINPEWKYALVLNIAFLEKRLSKNAFLKVENSNLKFELKTNIDNTPEKEKFFVGIYETKAGVKGRYLAIMHKNNVIRTFSHSGFAGYSSIYQDKNTIRWYKCMECGDYDVIVWSGKDYIIK